MTASRGALGQVGPIPPPAPPAGPTVLLTSRALDGEGGTLRNARIGIANGRITSLAAPSVGPMIDLRGYILQRLTSATTLSW